MASLAVVAENVEKNMTLKQWELLLAAKGGELEELRAGIRQRGIGRSELSGR